MHLRLVVQPVSRVRGLPRAVSVMRWARAALAGAGPGTAEVTVRLVDETESAALNRRYRGKRGSTNVLSFSYDRPAGRPGLTGDLVICAPVVVREAHAQGRPARAHWAHMVVHGIMHLRGLDHRRPDEAEAMEALEARALRRLGIPNPYSDKHHAP